VEAPKGLSKCGQKTHQESVLSGPPLMSFADIRKVYMYKCIRIFIYIHLSMHIYMYVHIYVCTYICKHAYTYICILIYIYTYIFIHV